MKIFFKYLIIIEDNDEKLYLKVFSKNLLRLIRPRSELN